MRYCPPLVCGLLVCLAGCIEGHKPTSKLLVRANSTEAATPQTATVPQTEPVKPAIPATPPAATLYERLGEEKGITKAVDDFVANVVADENIKDNHKKHFKEGDVAGLKKKLVDQVGEATGGPQKYTGKNMKEAHKGLEITDQDFDALLNDLAKALDMNKVAEADRNQLLKMLEGFRAEVVEKKPE
jgi:hemoglobin